MRIPKKIKVSGITYSIEYPKADEMEESGKTHHMLGVIKIAPGIKEAQEVTFLHELIHCINTQLDEVEVEAISTGLYQVIKDNPNIFYE